MEKLSQGSCTENVRLAADGDGGDLVNLAPALRKGRPGLGNAVAQLRLQGSIWALLRPEMPVAGYKW